jgi:esterase/lipase
MNKERREKLRVIAEQISSLKDQITEIKDEEQEAFDNTPESLQQAPRGQAMEEAIEMMGDAENDLDLVYTALEGAQGDL